MDDVDDDSMNFSSLKDLSELAIGSGFGFRYDFDFLFLDLIQVLKLTILLLNNERWFSEFNIRNAVLNIGINYPF
ncbi:MAG: hypothetical protein CM15mP122_3220 [Bacteroidota bacterium]|nr:MAG: hypothetical protein CM15mP122_3220 [Bacteroidota bacterium]